MLHRKLRRKLREMGMDGVYLARKLNMTPQCLSARMVGRIPWRSDEMYTILSLIHEPDNTLAAYFPRNGIDLPEEYDNKLDEKRELLDHIVKLISIM